MRNFEIGLTDELATCVVPAIGLYFKNLGFTPVYIKQSN